MSNKFLDAIAKVDVKIDSPLVLDESFDKVLIVGIGPLDIESTDERRHKVAEYFSLEDVEKEGFKEGEPIHTAAKVAFSQKNKPSSIFIATYDLSDDGPIAAVKRAMNVPGWYVACIVDKNELNGADEPSWYEEIADYIETTEKLFCYTEFDFFKNNKTPTLTKDYARTFFIFGAENKTQEYKDVPKENKVMNVGWCVNTLKHPSGSETFAYKEIALCKPCDLSLSDIKEITKKGTCFVNIGNKNVTLGGLVLAEEWIDIIRFRDWLKNDMQAGVVSTFVSTPKIPYTDNGIGLIQNKMLETLKKGQDRGGIAPEEFDEDGVLIPAYSTSVPKASSVSASEKSTRVLKDCKFNARLAGAIHVANLSGNLSYEL